MIKTTSINMIWLYLIIVLGSLPFSSHGQQKVSDSLLNLINTASSKEKQIDYYDQLATHYWYVDIDSAIIVGEKIKTLSKEIDYDYGYSSGIIKIAVAKVFKGEYEDALMLTDQVIELNAHFSRVAAAHNVQGMIHYYNSDLLKAVKSYKKVIEVDINREDKNAAAAAHVNIANIFAELDDFEEAESYYFKAIDISLEANDTSLEAEAADQLSLLYIKYRDYDKALNYANRSMQLINEDDYNVAYVKNTLATIYFNKGEYDKAIELNKQSENLLKAYEEDLFLETDINFTYGKIYAKTDQLDKSIFHLEKAYLTSEVSKKDNIAEVLTKVYLDKGDVNNSKKYLQLFLKYSDSTKNHNRDKKFYKEIKNLELENLELSKNKEIENQKFQKILYIAVASLALISTILLVLTYHRIKRQKIKLKRKNKKINRQRKAIAKREKEKEWLLKEIHHRIKNNFHTISGILEIQSSFIKDEDALALIEDSKSRIKTMALTHQRLYKNDDISLDFEIFVKDLVKDISCMFQDVKNPNITVKVPKYTFGVDTSVPIGLIINELVTNAFKYGLDTEKPELTISVTKTSNDSYQLKVKDNGKGLDQGFDVHTSESLGMVIVNSFAQQLQGSLSYFYDNGANFIVEFKDINKRLAVENE